MTELIETGRKLRVKERKTYLDQELDDDDIEGKRMYKIEDKLQSDKYGKSYVKELKGEDFTLRYLQENGLQYPILFREKTGLGMRVPSDNFKVSDVKACVGSRRILDVMDVTTQKGLEMTMKEWVKYYENPERDSLLNVISLEFSHTKLENYVESPNLVREVDWVDTAWPQHLKDCQTESTNAIDKMKYPKVQKYCLMSVQGCYTDFHIDFGGTSVWYHILHGEKIFWLIPPTPRNLSMYENWVLSGKQGEAFLADTIGDCQKILLKAGFTFIIPSGWIHAVYTPKDSLVFGGNFLHSYNMVNQLRVSNIEDKTHVPMKFRYPFYTEINWYVLERYVHSLTGVTYLEKPNLSEDLDMVSTKVDSSNLDLFEEKMNKRLAVSLTRIDSSPRRKSTSDDDSTASGPTQSPDLGSTLSRSQRKSSSDSNMSADMKLSDKPKAPYSSPVKKRTKHIHLTKYELEGLIEVVNYVENLPPTKRNVPKDLIDPDSVVAEVKRLIKEHTTDNPELAVTGEPVLEWTKATKKLIKLKQKAKTAKLLGTTMTAPKQKGQGKNASGSRHRRVRCKKCEPCTRDDCMECNFCKDMKKYGGPGRAKQSCISRQCLAPMLPNNVSCLICKSDKSLKDSSVSSPTTPTLTNTDGEDDDYLYALMECGICWEIVHPLCLARKYEDLNSEGIINEDLPNSWKCSKCCFDGKEGQLKARVFKGGWRPNPTGTPPPQVDMGGDSQPGSPGVTMATEGKRVTLTQTTENKPSPLPRYSSSPYSPGGVEVKSEATDSGDIKPDRPHIKLEAEARQDSLDGSHSEATNGTNGVTVKPERQKRKINTDSEPVVKKKARGQSTSPKPLKLHHRSPGRPVSAAKSKSLPATPPEIVSKRTKREGTLSGKSVMSTPYDFDDSEMMDTLYTHPERGKGKGLHGKKFSPGMKRLAQDVGSPHSSKRLFGTHEPKPEESTPAVKKIADKSSNEDMKKSLLEHIERRNLKVVLPKYAVRPATVVTLEEHVMTVKGKPHILPRDLWSKIFSYLPQVDLAHCLAVCRAWNSWCISPEFWKTIDLSRRRIVQHHLIGIVRRQPVQLKLMGVVMTQKQILWLLERIPLLKSLDVSKCSWATISGLCMSACPLLNTLDLSWATGLKDQCFADLITPPVDRKPAVKCISRLHRLKYLAVAGTEITDDSIQLMTEHLPVLEHLNVSYCTRVTDAGVRMVASADSPLLDTLRVLDVSGCRQLTEAALLEARKIKHLTEFSVLYCIKIPGEKCRAFKKIGLEKFKW